MKMGKETRTGQNMIYKFFFATILACLLSMAGQSACFASTVVLQWDPNTDADLAGYKVYYQADSSTQPFKGTGATQGPSPIDVHNQTTETISGLDPAHPYYFAVTAYNTSGVESAYSNIVYVPELVSPTVSISYPTNNATVSGTVSVTASASDNVGVTKVEFYVNGALKTTDTSTPYLYSWNTSSLAAGSYTLMARAYDAAGNVGQSANVSVTVVKDTTAPMVSITAPANNSTISGTTTITATASDTVGVTKVEFYRNGTLLSATNVSPYSYSWNTASVTNGTYDLTAKAYDAANNVGQSSIVQVTVSNTTSDTKAPTVSMTAPVNNSTVSGTVSVTASASDNVGVSKVEFYVNGTLQATDSASPYTFSWNTTALANGSYKLSAKAYDAVNNIGQSATVTVKVNNPDTTAPTVSINAPASNATVSGTVSVTTTAGDNVGVSKVEFYVNGTLQATDTKVPYTFSWNTASLTNGAYVLSAKAYDAAGNVGQSSNVSVTVNNSDVSIPSGLVLITQGKYTKKAAVTLNLTAGNNTNVAAYCISNTDTCKKWTKATAPVTSLAKPWTLAAGADGNRIVNVWFKDIQGNVSAPASATIMLDTKAPVNGTLTPTQLAGNQIKLDWIPFSDVTSGLAGYKLVRGAKVPAASCTGTAIFTPSATDTTYTDTSSEQGMKYFYRLCAVDNAGSVSTGATTPAIMAIPEVNKPSGNVSITTQGNYTSKAAVTLNLTASDDTNVAAYCISNTSTCKTWTTLPTPVNSLSISPAKPWTLAAGADGNRTVTVWFKDVWGNVSAPASASTILDKTLPVNGKLAIDSTFTLNWDGFSDATSGIAIYALLRGTKTYPACSAASASAVIYSGSQTSYYDRSGRRSTPGTTYYYRICAVDNAGNISKGATASMKTP
jgi:chitinase